MSCLAGIQPRFEKDKKLIRKTIVFLGQQVTDISLDQRKTTASFAAALQTVDESVFDDDPAAVLKLANVLLFELDTTQTAFVETTYNTHSITLFALYQALLLVQRITAPVADVSREKPWFQPFKMRLKSIADCQTHFPFLFQVKTVEQGLQRLVENSPSGLRDVSRRVMSAMYGCSFLYRGVRRALAADIDLDSLVKGCEKLKETISCADGQREWYDEFLKLNGAALLSSEKTDCDNDFMSCFQEAMVAQAKLSRRQDADLLRFGIVTQLSYAIVHGESPAFCKSAMTELVYLATRYVTYEGWDREPAIVRAILLALQDAHSISLLEELGETAVLCMKSSASPTVRVSVKHL